MSLVRGRRGRMITIVNYKRLAIHRCKIAPHCGCPDRSYEEAIQQNVGGSIRVPIRA